MAVRLPDGFTSRPASLDDAEDIARLINDCTSAEIGLPWTSADEIRGDLTSPGRDPATEDVILLADGGAPAGYLQVWGDIAPHDEILLLVFVHPRHWGAGLGTFLIRTGEERARSIMERAPAGARVVAHLSRFAGNEPAAELFTRLGYEHVRTFWMMETEFADPPKVPDAPPGITIRTFDPPSDAAETHAALEEAFADHWGHAFPTFDQWRHQAIDGAGADLDPGLWFLAVEDGRIVGVVTGRARTPRDEGSAHVDGLGVRRSARGRGIGLALLLTSFAEFHRRGIPRASLTVDAENQTGATRLYERAGMHVAYRWEVWERELRAAASSHGATR
jgi:mycothiol synthase